VTQWLISNGAQLTGTVEVDEAYVGSGKGVGQGNRDKHAMILAVIQRGGAVRIRKVAGKRATRKNKYLFRDVLLRLMDSKALPYTNSRPRLVQDVRRSL
jgi:hypothetical protein